MFLNVRYIALIRVEAGRLLGDQRHRCDPGAKRQRQCFICAKAKRQQQQSAQPERRSTPRYG